MFWSLKIDLITKLVDLQHILIEKSFLELYGGNISAFQ